MRLPVRWAAFVSTAVLAAGAGFAQTPPAPPPPPAPAPTAPPVVREEIRGGQIVVSPQEQTVTTVTFEPRPGSADLAPQPLGYESDLHCFGYVGELKETFVSKVIGAESLAEQIDYITSDLLYLDAGHDRGLKVGDEYWLVTPEHVVLHPKTAKEIGRFYQYRGRAVIETLEGRTASARVTEACSDIPIGVQLKRFEPIPIPLARKTPAAVAGDPPSGKARGHLVYTKDGIVAVGADHTVVVDLGVAHGVEPGDFLTIFRYAVGREYGVKPIGTYWVSVPPPPGVEIPRTYLGEIGVLTVGDRWAIGRVTDSYRLIEVGDEVELK